MLIKASYFPSPDIQEEETAPNHEYIAHWGVTNVNRLPQNTHFLFESFWKSIFLKANYEKDKVAVLMSIYFSQTKLEFHMDGTWAN